MGHSVRLIADSTNMHEKDWGRKLRGKPTTNETEIHWFLDTKMPGWFAHLVRVTDLMGTTLKFRGVRLDNIDQDFGPDPLNDKIDYIVNLSDLRDVYPLRPSSLEGYVAGSSDSYALLLLSRYFFEGRDIHDDYPNTTPRDPHGRLKDARASRVLDGPKYPVSSGAPTKQDLLETLDLFKAQYAGAYASAIELFDKLGMRSDANVAEWLKKWAP